MKEFFKREFNLRKLSFKRHPIRTIIGMLVEFLTLPLQIVESVILFIPVTIIVAIIGDESLAYKCVEKTLTGKLLTKIYGF